MYALIDDATGETIATATDPSDLFAAEIEDDEIAEALACVMAGENNVPVGGGAAPLLFICNWSDKA